MDIVRLGIVGSGYMGRTYAHCVRDYNEGVELAGVTQGSRAPRLAADFGVEPFPCYEEMLRSERVDAVLLATIHKLHAEQTIAAARHGKHVLVEKPMMTNVADCDAMISACREAGVTLSVIHTFQTQDFVDCLRYGRPPAVSGEDGRAAIEMIEATHLSHRTGAAVELPLPRSAEGHHFDGATVERKKIPG